MKDLISELDFKDLSDNYTPKAYKHFDTPLSKKSITRLLKILSSGKIYRHYPFINYNIKFKKYLGRGRFKTKVRPISLPSHRDALMFKAYSILLNTYYENYLDNSNFKDVPIAYRSGKSNISGAKEIFDFIWDNPNCWIIKSDFKSFFDTLNHKILKQNLTSVLKCDTLPENWYQVFKFLTQHKSVQRKDLEKNFKNNRTRLSYIKNGRELSEKIKHHKLKLIDSPKKGIPQGTALSAVFANVYMITFDSIISSIVNSYNGIYRRYSDDFIIVIPKISKVTATHIRDIAFDICKLQKLTIEENKTKMFFSTAHDRSLYQVSHTNNTPAQTKPLDFLGFIFDGHSVHLRNSSIYKYHYRGKRTIKLMDAFFKDRKYIEVNNQVPYYSKRTKLSKKDHDSKRNYRLRRRSIQLYISDTPIPQRNMQSYATRAQKQLDSGRYRVKVLKQVQKQISYFRKRGWK